LDKVFVDTNIVIDFLGNRLPFADSAEDLFSLVNEKRVELYVSAASFDNIY
jgi:predicted nucleic acid-binding protein